MRQAGNNSGMEKPERESNPQPYCYRSTVFATAALCLPVSYLLIINLLLQKVNRPVLPMIRSHLALCQRLMRILWMISELLHWILRKIQYIITMCIHILTQLQIRFSVECFTEWLTRPDREDLFFFQHWNRAHNYSHAWLQMPAYLCQFGPVRICASIPHRCLSLHRFPGSHTWAFLSMPAPERNHSCTIGLHVLWLWQPSGILLILFYFINTDSYLVVGWGCCWGRGLWDRGQGCFPGIKDFLAAY